MSEQPDQATARPAAPVSPPAVEPSPLVFINPVGMRANDASTTEYRTT